MVPIGEEKVVRKNAKGLAGRYKLLLQFIGCLGLFAAIWLHPQGHVAMRQVMVPFLKAEREAMGPER